MTGIAHTPGERCASLPFLLTLPRNCHYSEMKKNPDLLPYMNEGVTEAGCDEAGRGPLAGPVFAAAVILPPDFSHPLLDDSKKMSVKNRDILRDVIEKEAVAFSVIAVSPEEIDAINILNASIAGMQRAVTALDPVPEYLLIDGNRFRPFSWIASLSEKAGFDTGTGGREAAYDRIPYDCIVKGDAKFASIAAASVLAKTYRDEYMKRIAAEYPEYGWDRNMGYPTKEHIGAIMKYGLTPYHRRSFRPKELEPALW